MLRDLVVCGECDSWSHCSETVFTSVGVQVCFIYVQDNDNQNKLERFYSSDISILHNY